MTAAGGPLADVRIIEIAGIGPLPFAGMLLADMGAEIIRIETPRPRELQMDVRDPVLRGRASMTLDLKQPSGRETLLDLVSSTDILLEGLRPGKMEALGLGPDPCLARAPWLVYGRSTGWGQSGPLAASAGHDPNYVGYTGALAWLGHQRRPGMPPFGLVGDTAGGALYLVMGALAALHHARRTGVGQVVDAAILDGTLSLLTSVYAAQRSGVGRDPNWQGIMGGECPFATNYETADGRFMTTCALEPSFYDRLLRGLRLEPAELPDRNQIAAWPILREAIGERFLSESRAFWEDVFTGSDACASPVLTLDEAPDHAVNVARAAFHDGIPAAAPRLSQTPIQHAPATVSSQALIAKWQSAGRGS